MITFILLCLVVVVSILIVEVALLHEVNWKVGDTRRRLDVVENYLDLKRMAVSSTVEIPVVPDAVPWDLRVEAIRETPTPQYEAKHDDEGSIYGVDELLSQPEHRRRLINDELANVRRLLATLSTAVKEDGR